MELGLTLFRFLDAGLLPCLFNMVLESLEFLATGACDAIGGIRVLAPLNGSAVPTFLAFGAVEAAFFRRASSSSTLGGSVGDSKGGSLRTRMFCFGGGTLGSELGGSGDVRAFLAGGGAALASGTLATSSCVTASIGLLHGQSSYRSTPREHSSTSFDSGADPLSQA